MKDMTIDAQQVEKAARAMLDERVTVVRALARSRQRRIDAHAALRAAERDDASAWADALRAGWSEDQLKKVGLDRPDRRLPGRPRRGASSTRGPRTAEQRETDAADVSSADEVTGS